MVQFYLAILKEGAKFQKRNFAPLLAENPFHLG